MIGFNVKAKVIGKTFSKVDNTLENGVIVQLVDGEQGPAKGFLHISRMIGKTPEARAQTLTSLTEGSEIEVDVLSETTIDNAPGFRVSQWTVLRRARKQAAEQLMNAQTVIRGEVERLAENYAIISLGDDLQGLLHQERSAKFDQIALDSTVDVRVCEVVEIQGRLRVRLEEIVA